MFISEPCSPKVHAINFHSTRTTKRLQPVTAKHIFPQRAIKYHKIHKDLRGKWPTISLFFTTFMANSSTELWMKFLAYCGFPDIFIQMVSPNSFRFLLMSIRWPIARPGSGPDSSQHLKLSLFVFSMPEASTLWCVSK